ncbi:MAG TPA: Uma2 family endonuclease [Pirellulales bacterium]|nr:Uma2 family endonuclease [Pirellulales bacterium]
MATVEPLLREARVRLSNIDWQTYLTLRDNDDNRNVRMTYDRGILEIMSPSKRHERVGYLLGRFIDEWTDAFSIRVQACRSMTFHRQDEERGLEPDNCYYLERVEQVLDREEIDLACDPPPDLAIEVDVKSGSRGRLPIYASLGVPEVWRWWNDGIEVYRLGRRSRYQRRDASEALNGFPVAAAAEILRDKWGSDDGQIMRAFRKLVRQRKGAADQSSS